MTNPEDRLNLVQKDLGFRVRYLLIQNNLQCSSFYGVQHAMIVVFLSFDGQSQINGCSFEL